MSTYTQAEFAEREKERKLYENFRECFIDELLGRIRGDGRLTPLTDTLSRWSSMLAVQRGMKAGEAK